MITVQDIRKAIEEVFPPAAAMEWDNPGLICGRNSRSVSKVLIALDASPAAVKAAAEMKADLLLTHHPLIFRPVSKINDESFPGGTLLDLIEAGIACYAMHTNFDGCRGGMADVVAERLGIGIEGPLEPSADGETGIGFVGTLDAPVTVPALAARIKALFSLEAAAYFDAGKPVVRAACCPGSGHGMLEEVLRAGADVMITGDMTHHDGIDYLTRGISLIDAGHYGLEQVFCGRMEQFMTQHFPELEIGCFTGDPRHFAV